jgi:SNF2 family DNA or RNA helicase
MTQAEDRLCRIGQKKMVHIIHPILEGTLDANMVRRVVKKQEIIDQALDRPPEQLNLWSTRKTA